MLVVSVIAIALVAASYVTGEFESTARANFGLTLRTQAAFGLAYAGYSILHGLWHWCEPVTVKFWLALWVYLTALAPVIGASIAKGGVVRDPELRAEAVLDVVRAADTRGWGTRSVTPSPLPGPSGNVEFFVWLSRGPMAVSESFVHSTVSGADPLGVAGERVES